MLLKKAGVAAPLVSFGTAFGRIADEELVRRNNERFVYLGHDERPALPIGPIGVVAPKSLKQLVRRILGRK